MVEQLCGTWALVDSQNFDEYMVALGVNFVTRQVGKLTKPSVTISIEGDRGMIKTASSYTNHAVSSKFGEEFDESTPDGRKVKAVLFVRGNKLHHVQKWDGKVNTMVREVKDGKMITAFTFGGVTSIRTYEKVS